MTTPSVAPARRARPARTTGRRRRRRHRGVIWGLLAALALGGLGGGVWLLAGRGGHGTSAPAPEALLAQMVQAADGGKIDTNVYGGALVVERSGPQLVVTVDGIPPSACVSVGWKLVRRGLLSINGTTPMRVSAARLADLCNQGEGTALIAWIPRPE